MLHVRRSNSRGYAQHDWLESYHSFSFASYHDPEHMGYSVLRVINDDKIAPGAGFGMHGHQDMEIITYMLAGELCHTDSLGHRTMIRAGDVQRMSAGSGVRHSEVNPSSQASVHLLQIWIVPDTLGLAPGYEDKSIPLIDKLNRWALIASSDAREGSLTVHQDLSLYATVLAVASALPLEVRAGRCAYVHVVVGEVSIGGAHLHSGDALKVDAAASLEVRAMQTTEMLWFDLPVIAAS